MLGLVVACGASTTSEAGHGSTIEDGGNIGTFGGADGGASVGPGSACATASATSEPLPVNIVFMFDRSDSMAELSKWDSCKKGLKAFFADPKSKGISASIQYFCGQSCDVSVYQTPAVGLTALPESTVFAASMDAQDLCRGTPTTPALKGAIVYAEGLKTSSPMATTVVALVTDGLPSEGCGDLSVVADAAQEGASKGIKTYVIGVGGSLTNLNTIASSGGTTKALIVKTNNPTQINQDFENLLDQIRSQSLSCDFSLPEPPSGMRLDVNAVNVQVVAKDGAASTIPYSKECADGSGWNYDDIANPTKVQLCASSCDMAKATGSVQVFFGCATVGGVR